MSTSDIARHATLDAAALRELLTFTSARRWRRRHLAALLLLGRQDSRPPPVRAARRPRPGDPPTWPAADGLDRICRRSRQG
ncbi:hypothetical protein [Micromonospora sp. NPDC000442]|uniref:hypothetical protein n=1 Tax=Micromonospora sp. NPDC000442 TaxID=3364217 RepID=UPI0036C72D01